MYYVESIFYRLKTKNARERLLASPGSSQIIGPYCLVGKQRLITISRCAALLYILMLIKLVTFKYGC